MGNSAPSTLTIDPTQFRARHIHLVAPHLPGMHAIAALLQKAGASCSRCQEFQPTAPCPHILDDSPDLLVVPPSLAHTPAAHPDLGYASEHHLPIMASPWLLGTLIEDQCVCAVLGPQAPQIASWLNQFLVQAGYEANYADMLSERNNLHLGQSSLWVVTSDAAYRSFYALHPRLTLITGIPNAVLPGYDDPAAVQRAFDAFIAGMDLYRPWPYEPTVVLNDDDAGCRLLAARMAAWPGHVVRYRLSTPKPSQHGVATHITLRIQDRASSGAMRIILPVATRPHLASLLGAIFAARRLNVQPEAIIRVVSNNTLFVVETPTH
jgi:UDP-N-acetylmuramate-alanine ligase